MKKEKQVKKQKTSPAKKWVRLICIILAILMVGSGLYYLISYIVSMFH